MTAREVRGMGFMAFAGLMQAAMVVVGDVVQASGLPFFLLASSANLAALALLVAMAGCQGSWSKVISRQFKWIGLRGFCGPASYVLVLLAVNAGVPLGDASALLSINAVVAALLGRAFLGEPLRGLHVVALGISVTGAMLVTKAHGLLGLAPAPSGGRPLLGYGFALASGAVSGSTFIAARKSQDIDPLILTASACLQGAVILFLLPTAGVVHSVPLGDVLLVPWWMTASAWAGWLALVFFGSFALSAGAQMCPAAAASTVNTSANMLLSFVAEVLLRSEAPEALSVVGAGLLLLGVSLMAAARALYPSSAGAPAAGAVGAHLEADNVASSIAGAAAIAAGAEANGDEDESGSLASFIASEFSGLNPSSGGQQRDSVRQRRAMAVAALPGAQAIGAASP